MFDPFVRSALSSSRIYLARCSRFLPPLLGMLELVISESQAASEAYSGILRLYGVTEDRWDRAEQSSLNRDKHGDNGRCYLVIGAAASRRTVRESL